MLSTSVAADTSSRTTALNQHSELYSQKLYLPQNSKVTDRNFYYCDCGRKYSHERHLKYHLKYECGKKLKCKTCSKTFKDIQYYRLHVDRCANKQLNFNVDQAMPLIFKVDE